jgi:hypothetical protein
VLAPGEASDNGRARTSCLLPASSSPGTLSPAPSSSRPFRCSHSIRPARTSLMVSELLQHSSAWPSCSSAASSAVGVLLRRDGGAGGGVKATRQPSRRALHPDAHPASQPPLLASRRPPPTMQSTLSGAARTGTFWRFAGRPSLSPTEALAALRLAALSISVVSRSRRLSKQMPNVVDAR